MDTKELSEEGGPYLFIKSPGLTNILSKVNLERYHKAGEWLREHFQDRKVRILDLACGTGYGSKLISRVGEVVGVDLDKEVVDYANHHFSTERTSFIVGNADDHNFLNRLGEFDAIVSLATIEHLEDHYEFFRWVKRVLRPDGVFIVSFPSAFTMDWAAPHHKRDISCCEARVLFKETGFKIRQEFHQTDWLDIRHALIEIRTNKDLPAPPFGQWVAYYLRRPDHFIRRAYQIIIRGGALFRHQQYLLSPAVPDN